MLGLPRMTRNDKMVGPVERMLELHKQLPKAKTPHEQEFLKRTITATDRHMDAMVFESLNLVNREIGTAKGTAAW